MQNDFVRRFMEHRENLSTKSAPVPVSQLKSTKSQPANLTLATILETKPKPPEVVEFFKKCRDALIEEMEAELK